ncbi:MULTISPECIES: hypothetical protein [unclassified Microcoleus]|uniref:hypothetical protein n=1 Tax=unclassified Microcoleus TaxID=2642155 RepID=UPI002FCF7AAF
MDNLSDILKKIKNKPSVYLGKPSISCLQAFLSGYNVAQYQLGLPLQQENPLDGFQDWIQKKFNIDSSQSWANIILFFSQDETDALDIFFQLFEEFCQSKVHIAHPTTTTLSLASSQTINIVST